MTGTSAKVPAGTIIKSFVDEDVPLNIVATAPAPMTVAPSVQPMTVNTPAGQK
jgi:hypothetical protein